MGGARREVAYWQGGMAYLAAGCRVATPPSFSVLLTPPSFSVLLPRVRRFPSLV